MTEIAETTMDEAVRQRYSAASKAREAKLCCPVDYDTDLLKVIPKEVIERDYGCGDPSKFLKKGETVLDLGSGSGKICFIASQVVGESGKVIGVDINNDMLSLSRDSAMIVAEKIGYSNCEFRKGKIEDLQTNRVLFDERLRELPISNEADLRDFETWKASIAKEKPLVETNHVDAVVSNCVLNLVDTSSKTELFKEIYRVLKPGGRAIISDIVADQEVPLDMQADPELWSGCISGAFEEADFLKSFERAGFVGITLAKRDAEPWQVVEDIEFRSATVVAYKPSSEPHLDKLDAVIYKGPFKATFDDDGQSYVRGERIAVSSKTMSLLAQDPYSEFFELLPSNVSVSDSDVEEFVIEQDPCLRPVEYARGGGQSPAKSKSSGCC